MLASLQSRSETTFEAVRRIFRAARAACKYVDRLRPFLPLSAKHDRRRVFLAFVVAVGPHAFIRCCANVVGVRVALSMRLANVIHELTIFFFYVHFTKCSQLVTCERRDCCWLRCYCCCYCRWCCICCYNLACGIRWFPQTPCGPGIFVVRL